jgi:adenylyltransferase/sulfurtransferase
MSGEGMTEGASIDRAALKRMYAHARETFPSECCGYLLRAEQGVEVVACTNRHDQLHALDPSAHPRTSANGYNIGGGELLRLVRSFDSQWPATVIYHSHPRVGAYFSDEDTRAALAAGYPVDYLVIDAQDDEILGAVLYRREDEHYVEVARFGGAPLESSNAADSQRG